MRASPRKRLLLLLGVWAVLTASAGVGAGLRTRIGPMAPPSPEAVAWAEATLESALLDEAPPPPPEAARAYHAAGPIVVTVWRRGRPSFRHLGSSSLVTSVTDAAEALREARRARRPLRRSLPMRPRITVPLGHGPLALVPFLRPMSLLPLLEGLEARIEDRVAVLTPDELFADGVYEQGTPTPIPELRFGLPIDELEARLARELGVSPERLRAEGTVRRFSAASLGGPPYPEVAPVTEAALREAAVEGARFLLRHQHREGHYTYVYDAGSGRERPEHYNLPRHAGTTYFLAQMDHLHGMPEARQGALRALAHLEAIYLARCGGPEKWCIQSAPGRADVGSSALTVVAAAEILAVEDDPLARGLVEGLTAFLRAQQRPDGELMHEYDLEADQPIDVQYMYYSGEAAFALLRAHAVAGDARNLEAARRIMAHLTGGGWDFLGSRYYYGEEHWTCIATGESGDRLDTADALDFCARWLRWNDAIQFREGDTPWASDGAYGAGPLVIPRLTPVGSRSEALIAIYDLFEREGRDTRMLRRVIERGLSQMMRHQWTPGPRHLFASEAAARGGLPGSPAELTVRNDYVQHAGSAFLRWADRLRREAEAGGPPGGAPHVD